MVFCICENLTSDCQVIVKLCPKSIFVSFTSCTRPQPLGGTKFWEIFYCKVFAKVKVWWLLIYKKPFWTHLLSQIYILNLTPLVKLNFQKFLSSSVNIFNKTRNYSEKSGKWLSSQYVRKTILDPSAQVFVLGLFLLRD